MVVQILSLFITIFGIFIGFFIGKKNANKKDIKTSDTKDTKNKMILKIVLGLVIGIIAIIIIIFAMGGFKEKIDVKGSTMTEYLSIRERYGQDIDFNGIESGANCYTGTQTKTIDTKKYGKVTVDFSYCKASKSVYIHVFN